MPIFKLVINRESKAGSLTRAWILVTSIQMNEQLYREDVRYRNIMIISRRWIDETILMGHYGPISGWLPPLGVIRTFQGSEVSGGRYKETISYQYRWSATGSSSRDQFRLLYLQYLPLAIRAFRREIRLMTQ